VIKRTGHSAGSAPNIGLRLDRVHDERILPDKFTFRYDTVADEARRRNFEIDSLFPSSSLIAGPVEALRSCGYDSRPFIKRRPVVVPYFVPKKVDGRSLPTSSAVLESSSAASWSRPRATRWTHSIELLLESGHTCPALACLGFARPSVARALCRCQL